MNSHNTCNFKLSEPNGEISALTSLRGVAAMAVVMQHFSATAQQHSVDKIPSLVPHGYLAVDLFFILSGFIMSYTYLGSFQQRGFSAYGTFLLKRFGRIIPLNVAALAVILIAGQLSMALLDRNIIYYSENLGFDVLANLFMLQGLGIGRNLNGPSWSISTEFAAYFIFPFLIQAVFSKHWRFSLLIVLTAVSAIFWLAFTHQRLGLETGTIGKGVVRCFAEFTLGMASYSLYTLKRSTKLFSRDTVCFGLAGCCILFMGLRIDLPAVLLFPFLIVSIALNKAWAARMLAHPFLYFLGLISFSLYLLHQLFRPVELEILQALHPAPLHTTAALAFALIGSFSVVPFAWLAYCYVERPGRAFFRNLPLHTSASLKSDSAS
jgi:peptidoglycan/LPS O-acetylase OafA/YrhL